MDQLNLTEAEFFKRELSFDLEFVFPQNETFDTLNHKGAVWIASTNPKIWLKIISESPRESVVFFFLGNELYLVEALNELTKSPSILSLFVYSPARNQSSKNLISAFLGSCLDSLVI